MKVMVFMLQGLQVFQRSIKRANEILRSLERKSILGSKKMEKENKQVQAGQLDLYNYKLAEIAQELDKIDLNTLTPIDALNTLMKIKENEIVYYKRCTSVLSTSFNNL